MNITIDICIKVNHPKIIHIFFSDKISILYNILIID